jgi:hypothetical protein
MARYYNCHNSGHYPPSCLLFKARNVSETGFCLSLEVEATQLGQTVRAREFEMKDTTMDNVEKGFNCFVQVNEGVALLACE